MIIKNYVTRLNRIIFIVNIYVYIFSLAWLTNKCAMYFVSSVLIRSISFVVISKTYKWRLLCSERKWVLMCVWVMDTWKIVCQMTVSKKKITQIIPKPTKHTSCVHTVIAINFITIYIYICIINVQLWCRKTNGK